MQANKAESKALDRRQGSRCRALYRRIRRYLSGLLAIDERIPLLVLATWAILYASRPFQLGFYHDDWWSFVEPAHGTAGFSLERLKLFVGPATTFAPRPVAGLVAFLLSSISGSSAFVFQVCGIVLVLMAALSLRAWLKGLLVEQDRRRVLIADLGTMFWLAIPWSLASTAFLTSAVGCLTAQLFFTEAARRSLPPRKLSSRHMVVLGLLLAASYLAYESFYFVFLVVAVFCLQFHRQMFQNRRAIYSFLGAVFGAQLLAIGFNRYIFRLNPSQSKKFAANWFSLFEGNLWNLPRNLHSTVHRFTSLWVAMICVLVVAALATMLIKAATDKPRRLAARILGMMLLGASVLPISTLTYSLAGYSYSAQGIDGRTLLGVSFGVTLIFFSLISTLLLSRGALITIGLLAAALSIVYVDAVAQKAVVSDWAIVWRQEQQVLEHVPVAEIDSLPPDSRVLYIGPSHYHNVVVFGADWDITAAVFSVPGLSRGRKAFQGLTWIHSATMLHNWSWDGERLVADRPGNFTSFFPAKHLFVWNYDQGRVFEVEKGFRYLALK